jgi:hypothetical protein
MAQDRTVEFPLCKYAEVMASIVLPEMDKQASLTFHKSAAVGKSTILDMEKFASYSAPVLNEREELVHFAKMASIANRELEQLRDRSVTIVPEIEKTASAIQADSRGLEKLATIANGEEFRVLSTLVYGSAKQHNDTGLFKAAELKAVEKIAELYKEAKTVQAGIDRCQAIVTRTEHVKQASIAGAIGGVIGRAIGTVASAPLKPIVGAATNTAKNMGSRIKATAVQAQNSITGSKIPVPAITKHKGVGTLAKGVGIAALDATMYQPGKTKTGTSKDVWDALQRS